VPDIPVNSNLLDTATPPIPEAAGWLRAYDGREGRPINLSQAVPSDPPPRPFLDRLAAAAGTSEAARYGDIFGDEDLRKAYAEQCARTYHTPFAHQEVAVTAGCNQAFFVTIMAIARAGDAVILPAPWYFNHKMTLDMLGIETRPLQLSAENGFIPDPVEAEKLIDKKVKAIVLVTPNNPTGAIYPGSVVSAFKNLCAANDICLILDETYRDFIPGNAPPHEVFADPSWRKTVLGLYSFSKSYAIPGHRVGAITGSGWVMGEIGKVLDCVQINPPRAPQQALPWAINNLDEWRAEVRADITRKGAAFKTEMSQLEDWKVDQLGTYFAYVRHPFKTIPCSMVAEQLAKDCGVLALPGSYFGPGQERHLRVAFANVDLETLSGIARRFAELSRLNAGIELMRIGIQHG